METYVSFKKNTGNKNSSVRKTKQNILFSSNCAVSGKKKLTLKIKNF